MGFNRGKGTTSAAVIAREAQVLELRRAGLTFQAIADQIDGPPKYDRAAAYLDFKRALARVVAPQVNEVRDLEADRLDRLQVAVWAKALRGDLKAVDRVIRISERRSRLLGLDHADGVADRVLRLEQEKVKLVALAFGKALDSVQLTPQQRDEMTRVLLTELRVAADSQNEEYL